MLHLTKIKVTRLPFMFVQKRIYARPPDPRISVLVDKDDAVSFGFSPPAKRIAK